MSAKTATFELNLPSPTMKNGDTVLISPDLTHLPLWIEGKVIEVEDNPIVGIVIAAETADGNVFFDRIDMFRAKE